MREGKFVVAMDTENRAVLTWVEMKNGDDLSDNSKEMYDVLE